MFFKNSNNLSINRNINIYIYILFYEEFVKILVSLKFHYKILNFKNIKNKKPFKHMISSSQDNEEIEKMKQALNDYYIKGFYEGYLIPLLE